MAKIVMCSCDICTSGVMCHDCLHYGEDTNCTNKEMTGLVDGDYNVFQMPACHNFVPAVVEVEVSDIGTECYCMNCGTYHDGSLPCNQ